MSSGACTRLSKVAHVHGLGINRFTYSLCRRVRRFEGNTGICAGVHRRVSVIVSGIVQIATLPGVIPSHASSNRSCGETASGTPCIGVPASDFRREACCVP